jgi:predicted metal-dependent HD superfamily phosphohydrolase
MTSINTELLHATENYARDILTHQLPEGYVYHNLAHTEQVVHFSATIGRDNDLTEPQLNLLQVAAWFHDLGYLHTYVGHEEASQKMARQFLAHRGVGEDMISRVEQLIAATNIESEPQNLLEQILKDADLNNLGSKEALNNSQKIRLEWKSFCDRNFTDEEWDEFNYQFFAGHDYFTTYAQEVFDPLKNKHVRKLKKAVKKHKKKGKKKDQAVLEYQLEKKEAKLDKLKRKLKKMDRLRPDRGIETMFRTTYRTHINLSSIADNKANILLSINAIIISIIFTNGITKFRELQQFVYPSIVLLLVCMGTMVFAVLATRPKVNSGIFDREDIVNKKTNLLFFGNFYRMDLEDYLWGIDQMMKNADYLYGSMSTDIYFLGKVLAKKFMLLRISYNIFMYGMAGSILAYIVAFMLAD